MKCYYCENEVTRKDYRTVDGITGKILTCDECFGLNDNAVRDRYHEVSKAVKEIFDHSQVDEIIDKAMGEFWDTVNAEVDELKEYYTEDLKSRVGIYPHETTIEKWREEYFNLIQFKTKKQL